VSGRGASVAGVEAGVAWQPSLLDGGEPQLSTSYSGIRRIRLDARSWVDHCPGWLSGSDAVFAELAGAARWQQRSVQMYDKVLPEPRLTAGWSTDAHGGDAPAVLRAMCRALSERYAVEFDRVWVNLYRDGRDSVAWHGDRNRLVMTNPIVATVSLGGRRSFLLRPRGTSAAVHRLEPGFGDLIVMGGACQSDWEHTVPKTARAVAARMSVTIRHSQPAPGERWIKPPSSSEPGHAW
jgi:alkylated DNA repair dioxygenase AlkB